MLSLAAYADPEQEFDRHFESNADHLPEPPLHGSLWPAAKALAAYLWELGRSYLQGQTVLELGCGLALPSLVCYHAGAQVLALDHQPEAELLLNQNQQQIKSDGRLEFRLGSFADKNLNFGQFDWLIGSDILYEPDLYPAIQAFLLRHGRSGSKIIIADPGRFAAQQFAKNLALSCSHFQCLGKSVDGESIDLHVFEL